MIDENKDGKIIEILEDNKYKIEIYGSGEILTKSIECILPIELPVNDSLCLSTNSTR